MTDADLSPLSRPDWPALMGIETACAYMDLKPSSFRLLLARYGVPAVDLGNSLVRWRRRDLDGLIERLALRQDGRAPLDRATGPSASSQADTALICDPAQAALEAMARRPARGRRTAHV